MAALSLGRWLFALCLVASFYNHLRNVLTADRIAYDRRAAFGWRDVRDPNRLPWVLAGVPFVALAAAFAARWHEVVSGIALLALLIAVRRRAIATWGEDYVVGLGKYVPSAAALVAYLAASNLAGATSLRAHREAIGWEAACGVLAAAYVLAAFAKHEQSGWRWAKSDNVALLVAERAHGGARSLFALRMWAAESPRLCGALAKASMFVEAAGVAYLVSWLRWPFTGIATLLQLGIVVLLGYFEVEWIVVMVAVSLMSGA